MRPVFRGQEKETAIGLTTPVSEKNSMEMDIDVNFDSAGSRKVNALFVFDAD